MIESVIWGLGENKIILGEIIQEDAELFKLLYLHFLD